MVIKFFIKSPRQKRAILAILEKAISVKDLGVKIGALNPRQIIFELRHQGFQGIVLTRRFTVIDQDGKRCRPGEYFICQEFKPILEAALKEGGCLHTFIKSRPQHTSKNLFHDKEDV